MNFQVLLATRRALFDHPRNLVTLAGHGRTVRGGASLHLSGSLVLPSDPTPTEMDALSYVKKNSLGEDEVFCTALDALVLMH